MNKSIGTLITALLILLLAGLAMCATPELVEAPTKDAVTFEPVIIDGHPTGFIAPSVDVVRSNVEQALMMGASEGNGPPSSFDWCSSGDVTPVKNQQTTCGSCYAFASMGCMESMQSIAGDGSLDLSENNAKECNWEAVNNYFDGTWFWGSCNGGNDLMIANLLSLDGTVYESDDPYVASDVPCNPSVPHQKTVTEWVSISGSVAVPTNALKNYIYNNGPVYSAVDAYALYGYGGGVIDGSSYHDSNHAILIVGWNDNAGGPGVGAWKCKNSWGSGWGEAGFFRLKYDTAAIGTYASYMSDWQPYDPNGNVLHYDDAGYWHAWGWYVGGIPTHEAWNLAIFTPGDETATNIEFYLADAADVDVYLYDDFAGSMPSNLICSQTGYSYSEAGYYSVELDTPVDLTAGDDIIAVVHIDGPLYNIVADDRGPCDGPGVTYSTPDPATWGYYEWTSWAQGTDLCVRIRTTVEEGDEPEPPEPPGDTDFVLLENKEVPQYTVIEDDTWANVTYNTSGEEFVYEIVGEGLQACMCYYLIYYADDHPRFDVWGGDNPGALITEVCADQHGAISKSGTVELGMNLPEPPDWNIDPDPGYCCGDNGFDYYDHCCGAKLWLVPYDDYNVSAKKVINWNPSEWLFETDLIWYDDTGINHAPVVEDIDTSADCVSAGDEVTITAIVSDEDGYFDLVNMTVEADLSAQGINDPVTLEFVGIVTDEFGCCELPTCIYAEYEGTAVPTRSTVCECYNNNGASPPEQDQQGCWCTEFEVTACDPADECDTDWECLEVEPGPCDHLNFTSIGYTTLLKYGYTEVNIDWNTFMWWDYQLYFDALLVTCQDEFGNDLCDIECNPIVTTTGHASTVHDEFIIPEWFMDLPGTLVIVWNDAAVETCTLTAFCEDMPLVTEATIDIDFLEPIIQVNTTADDDYLFHDGDCACDVDCTGVSAQILDQYGEPIPMPNVPVQFLTYGYAGGELTPEWSFTDENGIATSELCIVGEENGTVQARAVTEARMDNVSVDVLEPPCYISMFADPEELVEHDECGAPECSNITGQLFDQYDAPVEVGGLAIELYFSEDYWQTVYTNEGGGIEATICTDHPDMDIGTNEIEAIGSECDYYDGNVDIEMVEPELTTILLTPDETPQTMILCEEKEFTATCYNQNDGVMCCPDDLGWIHGENVTWDNGTLTATSVGSDTVWVEDLNGYTTESNHIVIDVIQGDVARLEIEPEMIPLELCSSAPIFVTCFDCNNDEMDCGGYEVTIDLPEIASYSEGNVTGDAPGEATLTVTIGEVYNTTSIVVNDTCEDVTCEDVCFGYDLWSQICECGECVNDSLIEENNITVCGYDPCWDVTCDDTVCVGYDLHEEICVDGECVPGDLIEENCTECGYDPCDDMTCDDTVCVGYDLYNMTCECGECVPDALIEANSRQCGYSAPSHRGGGGGSSGGTYPPNWDKPKTTGSSSNATQVTVPTPTPTDVPESPTRPDASIPDDGSVGLNDSVNETSDEEPPGAPGFAGVFVILGILIVAYLHHRTKR